MKYREFMGTMVVACIGAGLILMSGCNGDNGDEASSVASVDVTGTWSFFTGGDHLAGILVLNQSGTTISGTYYPGGPGSNEAAGTVSGSLEGTNIQVSIVYPHGYNDAASGVVANGQMSGTGSGWDNVDTTPTYSDNIPWTAVKS